ncbi:unnamed protein product [Leuciscus chuanchicus]
MEGRLRGDPVTGYLSSWQCQLEEPQADANIPLLPGIVPSAYPCRALSCRDNQSSEVEQSQLQPKAQRSAGKSDTISSIVTVWGAGLDSDLTHCSCGFISPLISDLLPSAAPGTDSHKFWHRTS